MKRLVLWSTPEHRWYTEHIHPDNETGDFRTMTVVESADTERVVLFDSKDEPLVVEPWKRRAGFK